MTYGKTPSPGAGPVFRRAKAELIWSDIRALEEIRGFDRMENFPGRSSDRRHRRRASRGSRRRTAQVDIRCNTPNSTALRHRNRAGVETARAERTENNSPAAPAQEFGRDALARATTARPTRSLGKTAVDLRARNFRRPAPSGLQGRRALRWRNDGARMRGWRARGERFPAPIDENGSVGAASKVSASNLASNHKRSAMSPDLSGDGAQDGWRAGATIPRPWTR